MFDPRKHTYTHQCALCKPTGRGLRSAGDTHELGGCLRSMPSLHCLQTPPPHVAVGSPPPTGGRQCMQECIFHIGWQCGTTCMCHLALNPGQRSYCRGTHPQAPWGSCRKLGRAPFRHMTLPAGAVAARVSRDVHTHQLDCCHGRQDTSSPWAVHLGMLVLVCTASKQTSSCSSHSKRQSKRLSAEIVGGHVSQQGLPGWVM